MKISIGKVHVMHHGTLNIYLRHESFVAFVHTHVMPQRFAFQNFHCRTIYCKIRALNVEKCG